MSQPILYSVTDFVAVFNQTINYAYPNIVIEGELANFRVSKNRWVYFDLKDESASVKFFGSVYQLPGPLEEGMVLRVSGAPGLHPQFGFSITIQAIALAGEGTIRKAAQLLERQLTREGLFDPARKRSLPYPPARIGLIASGESAAYSDFIKVLGARWGGVEIDHYDVQVQGEEAASQIVAAINYFNAHSAVPDALVITRGGGSADDLQAFSVEQVVRAVAASRIPTLLAIGHERDISLSELAADLRASTPSNAAELLVPDRRDQLDQLKNLQSTLRSQLLERLKFQRVTLQNVQENLHQHLMAKVAQQKRYLDSLQMTLDQINPKRVLRRGYVIVRAGAKSVKSRQELKTGDDINLEFYDGTREARVQ